ncbi:hypothetical protein ES703_56047 [subsurface metagenome]
MAIVHTTDMLYTRSGAAESNVLSAHDPLIWEFEDTALVGGPATATVMFIAIDKDSVVYYTSAAFPAYLLSYADPLAKFRFDGTQIIKHIIKNYFYKEISTIIAHENYGSYVNVAFKTYNDGNANANDTVQYYLSQAVNQIGDEYGSNIPRLFLNDTEDIAHFLGYPTKIFFYLATDRSAHSPLIEIIDRDITESANLIGSLTNFAGFLYDTFTSTVTAVDAAINAAGTARAWGSSWSADTGEKFLIIIPALVNNGGELPVFYLATDIIPTAGTTRLRAVVGDNAFVLTLFDSANVFLVIENTAACDWECGPIQVIPVEDASDYGSMKLGVHCVDLGLLALSKKSKYARMYYDHDAPIKIKDYNLSIFEACENAIFIRWLNSNGDYSFWAFSPFPFRDKSGDRLGSVINNFTEMALANSRNLPLGYRDVFDKISVIASAVPLLFRRKMLEIFTSPAVYLWNGTPSENLITEYADYSGYDILTSDGTIILNAYNAAGNAFVWSDTFIVSIGEIITVILDFNRNTGQFPDIYIWDDSIGVISNTEILTQGFNIIELTCTESGIAKIIIKNTAATIWYTSETIVKRKEIELDWILLNRVEGSHNLMLKKDNDNFECTLVLPENFTQQLSGQNI